MTVTLYHRTEGGWDRRVLEDAWARWSLGVSHSAGWSRSDAAQSLLLIPWRADMTLRPGDGVLAGHGPEAGPGPLKETLPEVQIITEVVCHRPGSPLDHWEVTAR